MRRLDRAAFWTAVLAQVPGLLALAQTVSDPLFTLQIWGAYGAALATILAARGARWLSAPLKLAFSVGLILLLKASLPHWGLVVGEPEMMIASMLALLAMVIVAGATTLPEALMGIVPHLSSFGLIGTSNVNTVVAADFLAFVLMGAFSVAAHLAGMIGAGREDKKAVADLTILSGLVVGACVAAGAAVSVLTTPSIPRGYYFPSSPFLALTSHGGRFYDFLIVGLGNPNSDRVVMEVKGPRSEGLLRVAIYDRYLGTHWTVRPHTPRLVLPRRGGEFVLAPRLASSPGLGRSEVKVRSSHVDFVACPGRPVVVRAPVEAVWRDMGGTAKFAWPLPVGATYTVLYTPNVTLPWEDPSRDPIYTEPPLLGRLARLARAVAGKGGALERAKRIEHFLRSKYAYSTTPSFVPQGWDPVEYFLLRSKQGACDLFASAFVLMCRAVGIPARVVAGFRLEERGPKGEFIVREKHAHAWAEAWIPGRGWMTFDPTPPAPEEFAEAPLNFLRCRGWLRTGNRPFYVVALLSALAIGYAFLSRRKRTGPRPRGVPALYLAACERLRRMGVERRPDETPWEFLLRAKAALPPEGFEPFRRLTLLLIASVYGGRRVSEAEARRLLGEFKRGLGRVRKVGKAA